MPLLSNPWTTRRTNILVPIIQNKYATQYKLADLIQKVHP